MLPLRNLKNKEVGLSLLLVAALWGGSYLAAKALTEHTSVLALLAIRFSITSIAVFAIWTIKRTPITRPEALLGIGLGSVQALILFFETSGVSRTSATNAGLIISLCIVLTPILESIASRNWLPTPFFVTAVTAVVGVLLLVSNKGFAAPSFGDWLMLGAAVIRAIHVTSMGHLTKGKSYSSISITLLQSLTCAVIFLVFSGNQTVDAINSFKSAQWAGMLYLSLIAGAFSFILTLWGIRRTSSTRASLLLGTEPVWALLVGVTLGGERLLILGVIGAVLIVGSTYVGQGIEQRHRTSGS